MAGIVVGIDGSANAQRALEWAADEARLRGVPLRTVLAWDVPVVPFSSVAMATVDTARLAGLAAEAEQHLDDALAEAAGILTGLEVKRLVAEGAPAKILLDAASDADLLVVGTRGHGGLASLVLGSVSRQCAHHSPCPVVIVPHGDEQRRPS